MQPGDRVGPFVVESRLGAGQMGVVYAVRHTEVGARYALKVLRRELCTARDVLRFQREVEHLAAVSSHPRVVPIHTAGEDRGALYYVMDLVEGSTLQERLDRGGAMPAAVAARYARDVADALTALHRAGVVHRDIKPANVMIDARLDVARLADFGLARSFLDASNRLTMTGELVGTPHFMAPEQAMGEPVGAPADVYALGMVLFTLLAGRPAVSGKGLVEVLTRVGSSELERLPTLAPDTPDPLIALIEACLQRDPAARPEARAVRDQLHELLRAPPGEAIRPGSRRGGLMAMVAVGAAAAVSLAAVALSAGPEDVGAVNGPAPVGAASGPAPSGTASRPPPPRPSSPQGEPPYAPAWLDRVAEGKLEGLREALRGIDADGVERLSGTQRHRLESALQHLERTWLHPFDEEDPPLDPVRAAERVELLILVHAFLRRLDPEHRLPAERAALMQPFFVLRLGRWPQEVDPRVLGELVELRPDDTNVYMLYADGNKGVFTERARFVDIDVFRRGMAVALAQRLPPVWARMVRSLAEYLWSYGAQPQRAEWSLLQLRRLVDEVEASGVSEPEAGHAFIMLQHALLTWNFDVWPHLPLERRAEALGYARRAVKFDPVGATPSGHLVGALVAVDDDVRGASFAEARAEAARFFTLNERAEKRDELLATRVAVALCDALEQQGEDATAAEICARSLASCPDHPMLAIAVRRVLLLCRLEADHAALREALDEAGRRLDRWVSSETSAGRAVGDAAALVRVFRELSEGVASGALSAADASARLSTEFLPARGQPLPHSLPRPRGR